MPACEGSSEGGFYRSSSESGAQQLQKIGELVEVVRATVVARKLADIAAETYPLVGEQLNLGLGMMEALIRWVGKGSQDARRAAAGEEKSGVIVTARWQLFGRIAMKAPGYILQVISAVAMRSGASWLNATCEDVISLILLGHFRGSTLEEMIGPCTGVRTIGNRRKL